MPYRTLRASTTAGAGSRQSICRRNHFSNYEFACRAGSATRLRHALVARSHRRLKVRRNLSCNPYFLSANRIQYDWLPDEIAPSTAITVSVEGTPLEDPSVRRVAEALGFQTIPKHEDYNLIIAGAGPAGISAAVYGASENLRVLLVERSAAGGQAGTSSRIENYLGFPTGISGSELTDRALKQAKHFGVKYYIQPQC